MSQKTPRKSPLEAVGSALPRMRRANRIPIYAAMGLVVLSGGVIIHGLASRGLYRSAPNWTDDITDLPASDFGDRLKQGIPDAIIERPTATIPASPAIPVPASTAPGAPAPLIVDDWRQRLEREHDEQLLRERYRQQLLALQASSTAFDSPIAVTLPNRELEPALSAPMPPASTMRPDLSALYRAGLGTSQGGDADQQNAKRAFLEDGSRSQTALASGLIAQATPFELKRGSVIPAVLLTGINSDLPGQIIAQVSQNVFDTATGHHLLIPQGSRLFGRYDSDVSFGQDRVLVVWTDLIFPNGDSLSLDGMAGSDSQGFGGFADEVDAHYPELFGSALLVAVLGAGVEMLTSERNAGSDAEEAARSALGDSVGELGSQTVGRNLDVQPTLTIRPGYVFNVIVEQDIVFPQP